MDTHFPHMTPGGGQSYASFWHGLGVIGPAVGVALSCIVGAFTFRWLRPKPRPASPIHEDVVLSQEGAEIWKQVTDPTSPIGKPVHHRRRRMVEG